jgi:hypothetical protein
MRLALFFALSFSALAANALSYNDRLTVDGFDGDEETQMLERGKLQFLDRVRTTDTTLRSTVETYKLRLRNDLSAVECYKSDKTESRCSLQIYIMTQRLRNPTTCSQLLRWRRIGKNSLWLPSDEPTRYFARDPARFVSEQRAFQLDCDSRANR